MDTFRITVSRKDGDYSFDDIATATLSADVTDKQAAASAATVISQFAALLGAASKDAAKDERIAKGETFIRELFAPLRAELEEAREDGRIEALDSRDPRYVPSDDEIVKEHDPGPEVDDQGGASEFPRFTEELDRNPDGTPV